MIYDAAIIGTGPAGISAALNLHLRDKSFVWIGSRDLSIKTSMAERIFNYPGFVGVSGADLTKAFKEQIDAMGIEICERMATSIMKTSDHYAIMAGSDFFEARTVVLATGIMSTATVSGELDFVGRGVSYCATCDGNLYRGKTIAVICGGARFEHEVKYLADLANKVYLFPSYKNVGIGGGNIEVIGEAPAEILGANRVNAVKLRGGDKVEVNGVFCLRDSVALASLIPALKTENAHIAVDRTMATNLPGVFAAGDCTGRPYQYAKAIGEGNVAAHSVIEYLSSKE